MKFLQALGTQGGRTALIAFLWLTMLTLTFALRIRHIELTPDGATMLSDTSKELLAILVFSMGGGVAPGPAPPKEEKPNATGQ